jgi:uncharacterized protein YegP (UPF0339 family)
VISVSGSGANGQIIAAGEDYRTKRSALEGIESGKGNAATAELEDQTGAAG